MSLLKRGLKEVMSNLFLLSTQKSQLPVSLIKDFLVCFVRRELMSYQMLEHLTEHLTSRFCRILLDDSRAWQMLGC